ncbi:MAG: SBBP repeat-containing protein [Ignavibacteriae bacterium]|nr:SBBP repeat-containing protein [Ignavibacteriota bacterium]
MKIILIIFFISCSCLYAQVTQEWVTTFNGTGSGGNYAVKNAVDKFGNLIVAGRSDSTSEDYIILKYSNSGNLLWSKRYAGAANSTDKIRDMVLDDSGNIYVTGISYEGISLGGQNWLTIKYNSNGELVWKQSLNWTGNRSDVPASIALDKNNNVYVTGYGYVGPAPLLKEDLVVAKYNIKGNLEWTRSHSSPTAYSAHGFSVVTDSSNYVYVSGYSYDSIITIKYSESGNTMWERTFFNIQVNYVVPLFSKIDNQNNIIVIGYYTVASQENFVTLKYDNNGNLLWSRIFDSPIGAQDNAKALIVDDSSNIYVAGSSFTNFYFDVLLIKYAPNGDTLWVKTYDGGNNSNDAGNCMTIDIFGNVYVSGYARSDITYFDYLTIKFNPNGDIKWIKTYTSPLVTYSEDIVYGISIDSSNSVIISGSSKQGTNWYGITSIKYSQLTNANINSIPSLSEYKLYQNYPNPFNPYTYIRYEMPVQGNVQIEVYNINGSKVQTLVNEKKESGNHEIEFNGSNLSSGIYFYKFSINGKLINTKKLILLK